MSGAEDIYADFLSDWLELIESPEALALDTVQEGVYERLCDWKEQGIELVLVTMRKNKQGLDAQLKLTGLHPFLDAVLMCDHAKGGTGKADAVRNRYRDRPFAFEKHALWIGDTEIDWEAAQSLQCGVVLLSNGLREGDYLATLGGAMVMPSINYLTSDRLNALLKFS